MEVSGAVLYIYIYIYVCVVRQLRVHLVSLVDAQSVLLRRNFGPNRGEETGEWRNYIMRSLTICTPHQILFGRKTQA